MMLWINLWAALLLLSGLLATSIRVRIIGVVGVALVARGDQSRRGLATQRGKCCLVARAS